jgi:dTMP kinase
MTKRGVYIVIEGADGTGKSTQAKMLADYNVKVLGRKSLLVHNYETGEMEPIQEPGGTQRANENRRKLKDASHPLTLWEQVELFTDSRESSWNELIVPALEQGIDVITSRSYVSTLAYQGGGLGVDMQKISDYTREIVGEAYMSPDMLCILTLENEEERSRRVGVRGKQYQADRYESMGDDFQTKMQKAYLQIAEELDAIVIDAAKSQGEVFEAVLVQVLPILPASKTI